MTQNPLDAAAPIDAEIDAPTCPPAGEMECTASCGNGQIDTCYFYDVVRFSCRTRRESCDGELPSTCDEIGYYGGLACNDECYTSL